MQKLHPLFGKFLILLLAVFAAPRFARADGFIIVPHPPIIVPSHFAFAPLQVTFHKVDCQITDQLAVTSVDQEFFNPNSQAVEGDYIFPIPQNAQIDNFAMDIDGQSVKAELLPADKARAMYEDIVRKLKDPALLEYEGRDVFHVHIFPIAGNGKKHIQLKYTELLKSDNNLLHYHYTLNTEKFSSMPIKTVSIRVSISGKTPLTTIYSPTHSIEIKRDGDNNATVGYEASDARPDTDFHLYIGRKASPVGMNVLTYKPAGSAQGYFALLAAPAVSKDVQPIPKDVVFVLDTSGSMAGKKIAQAKAALRFCVNTLRDADRFNIIRFSTEAEPLFKTLQEATPDSRKNADTFIDGLEALGGTAIDDALHAALAARPAAAPGRMFMIVFLTDGEPTVGETDTDRLLANVAKDPNAAGVRIFSFGVGTDVNTALLDRLAAQTNAFSQYVLPQEDIEVAVSNFFSKVQQPVLADLQLDFGTEHTAKLYPKNMPDLFNGDQLVIFGTYQDAAKTAVTITGTANGKPQKFSNDATFDDNTDASNQWIAKLWAVRRIGFLLDEMRLHGENPELKQEVADLARQWGVVTPYTAMLIIEDEQHRQVPVSMHSLGEMENDSAAIERSNAGISSFSAAPTGGQAVANSINGQLMKSAESLDQSRAAAEQSAKRQYFAGQNAPALQSQSRQENLVHLSDDKNAALNADGRSLFDVSKIPESDRTVAVEMQNNGYRVQGSYAEQNVAVANRTFYRNGNAWVDLNAQNSPAGKSVPITFASPEYFSLLQKYPQAAPAFALGANLTIKLDNTIYKITP